MRTIRLLLTVTAMLLSLNVQSRDIRLERAAVTDSIMFDAIIDVLNSDSLQTWVGKYFYPNPGAKIKDFKFVQIAFREDTPDYYDSNQLETDAIIYRTVIIFSNSINSAFYVNYRGRTLFICNFYDGFQEYIRPLNKYRMFSYDFDLKNLGRYIIMPFYFADGKLHICTDEQDWIMANG